MLTKRIWLAFIIAVALAALALPASAQSSPEASAQGGLSDLLDREKEALVGSWQATFTSSDTPASFPPLPALFTFNPGGSFVETDGGALVASPPPDPTFGSPGHGVWRSLGGRQFALKMIIIVVGGDGTLLGKGTVQLTITLDPDGNHFHGEGTFKFVDADGHPIPGAEGPEKISGQRIEVD